MTNISNPTLIAAVGANREIGFKGNLPWSIPADMKFFKTATFNSTLIVGRKTFANFSNGLPYRRTIVVTSEPEKLNITTKSNVDIVSSFDAAVDRASDFNQSVFFAGGSSAYEFALTIVDRMLITHVRRDYEADAFFPEIDWTEWDGTVLQIGANTDPDYEIIEYTRRA